MTNLQVHIEMLRKLIFFQTLVFVANSQNNASAFKSGLELAVMSGTHGF